MKIKKFQNSGKISASKITAYLPEPNTPKGNLIANKLADRIENGKITLNEVPQKYKNYVKGIVAPGGSRDVSKAIVRNGVPIAAPIVFGAAAGPIGEVLSSVSPAITHGFKVLINPASANTTAGAMTATVADAYGAISGGQSLYNTGKKIWNGTFNVNDVPEAVLSGLTFLPGANTLTKAGNWRTAFNTARNISNNAKNSYLGYSLSRVLNSGIKNANLGIDDVSNNILSGKIGWGPKINQIAYHHSNKQLKELDPMFKSWDVEFRDAPRGKVWLTETKDLTEIDGLRPYHYQTQLVLKKPIIQLNEAIGSGKNKVRNKIVQFAQQTDADGIAFKNIKDNKLANQNQFVAFNKTYLEPIQNPTIDTKYNSAMIRGDVDEARRLHNMYLKDKVDPTRWYHSTDKNFTIFDLNIPSYYGPIDAFAHVGTKNAARDIGKNKILELVINQKNPLKTYDGIQDSSINIINEIAKIKNLSKSEIDDLYLEWQHAIKSQPYYDDVIITKNAKVRELLKRYGFDGIEYINKYEDPGSVSRGLIDPRQIKLANYATYDDSGNLIPLSKRYDFTNPDIRYAIPLISTSVLNSKQDE